MKSDFDRIRGLAANCLQQTHKVLEWAYLDHVCAEPAETVIKRLLPELRTTLLRTREVLGRVGDSLARPDTSRFGGISGRSHCEVAYNWSREVYANLLQAIDGKQGFDAADDVAAEIDWSALPDFTIDDIRANLAVRLPNEADVTDRIAWADAEVCRALNERAIAATEREANSATADDPFQKIIEMFPDRFPRYDSVHAFLDNHPEIPRRKKGHRAWSNIGMIAAALAAESSGRKPTEAEISAFLDEAENRKEACKSRRKRQTTAHR